MNEDVYAYICISSWYCHLSSLRRLISLVSVLIHVCLNTLNPLCALNKWKAGRWTTNLFFWPLWSLGRCRAAIGHKIVGFTEPQWFSPLSSIPPCHPFHPCFSWLLPSWQSEAVFPVWPLGLSRTFLLKHVLTYALLPWVHFAIGSNLQVIN